MDSVTGVIGIPPNPDNQIESTVVQESIQLPRMSCLHRILPFLVCLFALNRASEDYLACCAGSMSCIGLMFIVYKTTALVFLIMLHSGGLASRSQNMLESKFSAKNRVCKLSYNL
jgi:hypothetical protein